MNIERISLDDWDDALPSTGFEVFHLPEAISVVSDHTGAECRLYAGKKGQETVGLFPLFVTERPVGKTAFSPPPGLGVPRLGPLVMTNSPKQRKYEKANKRLVEGVLEEIEEDESTTIFRTVASSQYDDPRPFVWNELSIQPRFTYVVDIDDPADIEDLMAGFSKSLRNEMRRLDQLDVQIEPEGQTGAELIYDEVAARFAEQDKTPPVTRQFVLDLFEALDDRARAYVARDPSGAYLGGIITLYSNDLAYYWQGGVRNSYENVSLNTLIHRRILEDIIEDSAFDSITGYDLVGANTERLCSYKGQFGGSVEPYYVAESSGMGMQAVKRAYQAVSGSLTKN